MSVHVELDLVAIDELLNSPDGPVGLVIAELSDKAAAIAKEAAPVMKVPKNLSRWGKMFDPRYQYGPLGMTKAGVHAHFPAFNKLGGIYGGVNAPYGPTLFLERPAIQVRVLEMFMTRALYTVEL